MQKPDPKPDQPQPPREPPEEPAHGPPEDPPRPPGEEPFREPPEKPVFDPPPGPIVPGRPGDPGGQPPRMRGALRRAARADPNSSVIRARDCSPHPASTGPGFRR